MKNTQKIKNELVFTSSRSSGPGGQNVNKVNSRITLRWNIGSSIYFNEEQKELIRQKLGNLITNNDELVIHAEESRSQFKNKESAFEKFDRLISKVFEVKKKRKSTKPSISSVVKRLESKKRKSEKKKWRRSDY